MTNQDIHPIPECGKTSNHEVIIARNSLELQALRPAWLELLQSEKHPAINAGPECFTALVNRFPGAEPFALLVMHHAQPAAMLLGYVAPLRIRCKIGYIYRFLPELPGLTIPHGNLLGEINVPIAALLLQHLRDLLNSRAVSAMFFHYLPTHSSFYGYLIERAGWLERSYFHRLDIHRTMKIPASLDDFYLSCSAKHRANLRRYVRKLAEQNGGSLEVRCYATPEEVAPFLQIAAPMSEKTYQYQLGCGLVDNEPTRRLLRERAAGGSWRGHVLMVQGIPCAFQQGALYRDVYFLEQIGYDPQWKSSSVGKCLFLKVLEELCHSVNKVSCLDFGFGEADYKKSYGDQHWVDASFYLFARHWRSQLTNIAYSGTAGLSLGLSWAMEKTGLVSWLKRKWRTYLVGRKQSEEN